jgi:hypothetical protein
LRPKGLNGNLFHLGLKFRIDNERLHEIRQNTDWRALFGVLKIEKDSRKSRENDWWGKSPFAREERTASFHINNDGWYCFSTNQGGGPIELVQRLLRLNCYEAGRWLLESGVSTVQAETRTDAGTVMAEVDSTPRATEENAPIRQDLRPLLVVRHPEFERRGIPADVLQDLGIGFLNRPQKGDRPDPLNRRLVFQVRGLRERTGDLETVILTHMGRATAAEQEAEHGKWWMYPGFKKRFELYNLDLTALDPEAQRQAQEAGHVLVVEGAFDVAKLWAANIRNVVATFGAHLFEEQLPRFELLAEVLGVERFLVFYDRDQAGDDPEKQGFSEAAEVLLQAGYEVETFDWGRRFPSPDRGGRPIPAHITDPCEFTAEQLRWFRRQGIL